MFKKIGNSKTLSQEVQDQIISAIIAKKFIPGDKLPTEKELGDSFGVSRTAIREALQMLNAMGLVSIRKGSGTYVNTYKYENVERPMNLYLELNLDENLIIHVIEVRKIIEPQIAYLAATNRTEAHLEKILKTIEMLKKTPNVDHEKQGEIDRDFHRTLAEATGNPVLIMMFDAIYKLMPKIRSIVYEVVDDALSEALDYHQEIYNKLLDKDQDGARDVMAGHITVAENHSKQILSNINKS